MFVSFVLGTPCQLANPRLAKPRIAPVNGIRFQRPSLNEPNIFNPMGIAIIKKAIADNHCPVSVSCGHGM